MIKKIFFSFIFLLACTSPLKHSSASEVERVKEMIDQGFFELVVKEVGEPISKPYMISLSIKCGSQKKKKIIQDMKVCEFRKYRWDKNTKELSIVFAEAYDDEGMIRCSSDKQRKISLVDACIK